MSDELRWKGRLLRRMTKKELIEALESTSRTLKKMTDSQATLHDHLLAAHEKTINPPIMLTDKAEAIREAAVRDMKRAFKKLIGRLYWRIGDE